jgi:hypothetical protein
MRIFGEKLKIFVIFIDSCMFYERCLSKKCFGYHRVLVPDDFFAQNNVFRERFVENHHAAIIVKGVP